MIILKSRFTEIMLAEIGLLSSIKADGKEVLLPGGESTLVSLLVDSTIYAPQNAELKENTLIFSFENNRKVFLKFDESDVCITFEAVEVPADADALMFGPVFVKLDEVVGDIIGVCQGDDVALGIQTLNIKTVQGIPQEYAEALKETVKYKQEDTGISVGGFAETARAAARVEGGAVLHFCCRRRDRLEYRTVNGVKDCLVLPVKGDDAMIKGAKIAFFACKQSDALTRIGQIELEQGLPHPMIEGEWGKISRGAMRSYLITGFYEDDVDFVIEKAKVAGLQYIYHDGPFQSWGHFTWNEDGFPRGDEQIKEIVEKCAQNGIKVGVHTLTNFMNTNDAYVTPVPSEHLLKQGQLTLMQDIDDNQTDLFIEKSHYFDTPLTLNALQCEHELIAFGTVDEQDNCFVLKNCRRGEFETTPSAHKKETALYKLWDYPYNTLFPDLELQDEFCDRIVEIFNRTGLGQISFDGLEGCDYTGHDEYAHTRFSLRCFDGWENTVINDASGLHHFTWHMNTRMNWGEPWGEAMRTGQVEYRIKNQDFFRRNLFPRMLGWFLIRLADKKFECSTLEDLEWALSESAGFDAGYGMTIAVPTLHLHGQIDTLLSAMKYWDTLRIADAFTNEQKEKLKKPETEWHLEKEDENAYLLYPMEISKPYICNLAEMQPGQPGGSDWTVTNSMESGFSIRLKNEGEGCITNPSFKTAGGTIKFNCTIGENQYLLYSFAGTAELTNKNFATIESIPVQGTAALPKGTSAVAFSCEHGKYETPEVSVRFITRGNPEKILSNGK